MPPRRILVTGGAGQVAADLVPVLRKLHGAENIVAAGHETQPSEAVRDGGPFEYVDACSYQAMERLVRKYDIGVIYHLATILSGEGEQNPGLAWNVNIGSLKVVLDLALETNVDQVFWPSSIAVFGPAAPTEDTPQQTVLEPTTMYGVSKVAGESLCNYYNIKYGLDVRSLRYPGLINHKAFSGGGTSDYAVEVFIAAVKEGHYTCFVDSDTMMPMMYMDDGIKATVDLMAAGASDLSVRTSYNISALSFTAGEIAAAVSDKVPDFTYDFVPDFRQEIANSWPNSVDDSVARRDWGWSPEYDLQALVEVMLREIRLKFGKSN
tara:strand:+ start:2748 stop:3713 length:966 start_codon:yes stop_codon:yes gene_type:complete